MDGRNLRQPAVHPAFGSTRAENNTAVGQIARLNIVVIAVGQLVQVLALGGDFVKVVVGGVSGAVGEKDFFAS